MSSRNPRALTPGQITHTLAAALYRRGVRNSVPFSLVKEEASKIGKWEQVFARVHFYRLHPIWMPDYQFSFEARSLANDEVVYRNPLGDMHSVMPVDITAIMITLLTINKYEVPEQGHLDQVKALLADPDMAPDWLLAEAHAVLGRVFTTPYSVIGVSVPSEFPMGTELEMVGLRDVEVEQSTQQVSILADMADPQWEPQVSLVTDLGPMHPLPPVKMSADTFAVIADGQF